MEKVMKIWTIVLRPGKLWNSYKMCEVVEKVMEITTNGNCSLLTRNIKIYHSLHLMLLWLAVNGISWKLYARNEEEDVENTLSGFGKVVGQSWKLVPQKVEKPWKSYGSKSTNCWHEYQCSLHKIVAEVHEYVLGWDLHNKGDSVYWNDSNCCTICHFLFHILCCIFSSVCYFVFLSPQVQGVSTLERCVSNQPVYKKWTLWIAWNSVYMSLWR